MYRESNPVFLRDQGKKLQKRIRPSPPLKILTKIRAKAPASSSCELPILWALSNHKTNGIRANEVIKQVKNLFDELDEDDLRARYPSSEKRITDSVIKFSKKNLTLKGQIYPVGEDALPIGLWKITRKGSERAAMVSEDEWKAKYSIHDAILVESDKRR